MESQIESIETIAFQYRRVPGDIEANNFEITVEANIQWSNEEELLRAVTEVRIYPDIDLEEREKIPESDLSPGELSEYELCTLVTSVVFEIEDYERLLNGGDPDIPIPVVSKMTHTGVETTRGILFEKIKGTYLEGVMIPETDVNIIEEEMS